MKEKMEFDSSYIDQLNEKNQVLETEKKNLMNELEKLNQIIFK